MTMRSASTSICALLPWFVSNALGGAERRQVADHLRQCPSCQEDLPILQATRNHLRDDTPAIFVPRPDVDRFLATLERDTTSPAGRPRRRQRLAVAATILVALAGVLSAIIFDRVGPQPRWYETATSTSPAATFNYVFDVGFAPSISEATRSQLFELMAAKAVSGPDDAGHYRVVVELPALSFAELDAFREELAAQPGIAHVEAVALQLPIEQR